MPIIKIWIFNHYAIAPGQSGGTRHYDLAKELVKQGFSVTIYASSFDYYSREELHFIDSKDQIKEEEYQGVRFIWLRTTPYKKNDWRRVLNMISYTYRAYRAARKRKEQPDVIIGSLVHPLAALLGYILAKRVKCRFYFEERDLWPQTLVDLGKISEKNPVVWLLYQLEHFLYRKASRIIVLFKKAVNYVEQKGINSNKIIYLPNGVDLKRFDDYDQTLPLELEQLFNQLEGKFIGIYIGSHGLANGLDGILDTAKIIRDNNELLHFLFVGDGPEKERLRQRKREEGLSNVSFLPPIAKEHIPSLLKKANIGLMSLSKAKVFQWGISSNKIFDYMAASLPIILLSDAEETPIEESGGGIKVANSVEMAEAIQRLFADKYLRDEMGGLARDYVMKYHSWEMLSQKFKKVLIEDIGLKSASS